MEMYKANDNRYADMAYRRCGRSGLLLPVISLGLWHNFGSVDVFSNFIQIAYAAFDNGITHFDLANNYGPVYGSAEENFGRILKKGLGQYRDELVISTKAGYDMWPGPYGNWGSRKYLMASLDQSLKRMGLEYVDIFYSHRPDPQTPIEETMGALADIVRPGKSPVCRDIELHCRTDGKSTCRIERTSCALLDPSSALFDAGSQDRTGLVASVEAGRSRDDRLLAIGTGHVDG